MSEVRLRVSFRKFHPAFDPYAFFVPLIARVAKAPVSVVSPNAKSDLEVVSGFHHATAFIARAWGYGRRRLLDPDLVALNESRPSHLARRSIWYTGENLRPPLGDWNATWSFDPTSRLNCNTYFPLWWLLFPELLATGTLLPSPENRVGRELTVLECTSSRETDVARRPKFACAFVGNPEPMRMRAINALREIGPVDVFGLATGHAVPAKGDIARQYRFMVCFENDIWPGYVTEKAIDAWACGCVPIWCGLDPEGYLNEPALVNMAHLRSVEELLERVASLDMNRDALQGVSNKPILKREPSLVEVIASLTEVLR